MAVLAKIRQRSALMIVVIALALFAFIAGDLFKKGNFGKSSKDVGSINGKDISFEEFRVKVSNVEKSGQGVTSTAASNSSAPAGRFSRSQRHRDRDIRQ